MDRLQIRYFLAVCREKNISKAAKKLYLSPQGLNKAIHALEEELGLKLFERGRFGAELTESGQRLYEKARQFAAQYEAFEAEVSLIQEEANSLMTFGLTSGSTMMLPDGFFGEYFFQRPAISFRMYSFQAEICAQEIAARRLNVGFCPVPFDESQLESQCCVRSKLFLAVGRNHRLAGRKSVKLEELKGENLITIDTVTNNQGVIRKQCSLNGVSPNLILSPADRPLTMELVARGIAVTFNAGNIHEIHPDICRVELEDLALTQEFHIVTLRGVKLGEVTQDFIDYAKERLQAKQ